MSENKETGTYRKKAVMYVTAFLFLVSLLLPRRFAPKWEFDTESFDDYTIIRFIGVKNE